jgi:hypothetical protein
MMAFLEPIMSFSIMKIPVSFSLRPEFLPSDIHAVKSAYAKYFEYHLLSQFETVVII